MPFDIGKVEGINIREMRPDDFEILSSFLCELTILLLFKNQNLL